MRDDKQNTKTTVEDLRNHLQTTTDAKIGSVVENLQKGIDNESLEMFNDGFKDHDGPFKDHFKDGPDPFRDRFFDRAVE